MRQNRYEKIRMLPVGVTSVADQAARNVVYTEAFGEKPSFVRIKINTTDLLGIQEADTPTKAQLQQKRENERAVAAKFGIDGDAYRDREGMHHNGARPYVNESGIRLDMLLADYAAAGYKVTDVRVFQKQVPEGQHKPDPTVQITVSQEGEEIKLSERVKTFIGEVSVNGCYVYCNPKVTADGTPFRMDTINGFAGRRTRNTTTNPGRRLRFAPEQGSSGYSLY